MESRGLRIALRIWVGLVLAFLFIPIVVLYETFTQVVPRLAANGKLTTSSFSGVDAWLRWLPPGLAAHAIQDASTGHPGTALLRLALLAGVIVVLGWLWVRALGRALVTVDASTGSSRVHGRGLPFGRYGLRGAVAARYWIYQRREPMALIFWGIAAVIMVAVSVSAIVGRQNRPGVLIASAVFGAAFIGVFHANMVGWTGPPFVLEATALSGQRSLRAYLSGQNLAHGAIAVPLLIVISFGLALLTRHPAYGFLGVAVDLAGVGAALALSNIFTVTAPYPLEKRVGSPVRQAAAGYTAYGIGSTLGNLFGVALLSVPAIVAVATTSHVAASVRMPVLIVCAAAYGLALAWLGVRIAAAAAGQRLPELCQVALRSKL